VTFGPRHYMPVLKVKRGEKKALQAIAPALQRQIIPLMEIVERNSERAPTIAQHLETAFKDLGPSVQPYERFLLDTREIAPDGPAAAAEVFRKTAMAGMRFTPVTGVSRSADVAPALAHRSNGIAVRVTRAEFEEGTLTKNLSAFLSRHTLAPEELDLVVDLGAVEELIAEGIANLTREFLAAVPDQPRWRTLTVTGCAFPISMGRVDRHASEVVERAEWKAWQNSLYRVRHSIPRLPTYGDCAIQHPKGVEGFDPRLMQVSAAARYTLPDDWLLIKGESTRNVAAIQQFPKLAKRLVYGKLSAYFAGEKHCLGCKGIKAAADGAPKLGSAEAWRRLGTIHHITMVVDGLASLSWS
jgi:hypothetical protein